MSNFDPSVDYYEILQVHPKAHQEVIKRAYRTIVGLLQTHPDLGGSHDMAVRVNEAYTVLSNPDTRKAYDDARCRATMPRPRIAPVPPRRPPPAGGHPAATATRQTATAQATAARHTTGAVQRQQIIYCPRCGARNRLPEGVNLEWTICGKCHAALTGGRREAQLPALSPGVLAAEQEQVLDTQGEIRLTRPQRTEDQHLYCLRCRHEWTPSIPEPPPICPHCRSSHWAELRVFRCRFCRHQFCSANLILWPYWLFPECPACHSPHWHRRCERHPLRWVLNQVLRVVT